MSVVELSQALADLFGRGDCLHLKCLLGDYVLGILVVLNVAEQSQALADLYAAWFYSIWTLYWMSKILLNGILVVLNVAELSQALHELHAKWFFSIWIVYWVTKSLVLNYILVALNVAEFSQRSKNSLSIQIGNLRVHAHKYKEVHISILAGSVWNFFGNELNFQTSFLTCTLSCGNPTINHITWSLTMHLFNAFIVPTYYIPSNNLLEILMIMNNINLTIIQYSWLHCCL